MPHRYKVLWLMFGIAPATVWAQGHVPRVLVEQAALRSLPATSRLVATVGPQVRSTISAEVDGLVQDMPAREGDFIEAGGTLCRLKQDILSTQRDAARAQWKQLQARLAELEAGTRAEQVAQRAADYSAAQAVLQQWTFEKERIERLLRTGQVSDKEVHDTEAQYQAARQRMLAAQAAYAEVQNGPRPEEITQARFAAAQQKAVVRELELDLAKTTVRAPFAGYVSRRDTECGQWVQRGAGVVELIDLHRVLVRVDAPEAAFPYVHVGDEADIHVESLRTFFTGHVKHVVPQADEEARTFQVEIEVDNPAGNLKSGMTAWATLVTGPQGQAVAVPKDAVDVRNGTPYVCFVARGPQGTMAMPMPVLLGAEMGDWVAVISENLAPGTPLVVRGNERIVVPMPVSVTNAEKLGSAGGDGGPPAGASSPSPEAPSAPPTEGAQKTATSPASDRPAP